MTHVTKERLVDLEKRLLEGAGPDRVLDLAIERTFNTSTIHDDHLDRFPDSARHYTGSIDAALHLGRATAGIDVPTIHHAAVALVPEGVTGSAFIPVFARAFCLELIRAKAAKHIDHV